MAENKKKNTRHDLVGSNTRLVNHFIREVPKGTGTLKERSLGPWNYFAPMGIGGKMVGGILTSIKWAGLLFIDFSWKAIKIGSKHGIKNSISLLKNKK